MLGAALGMMVLLTLIFMAIQIVLFLVNFTIGFIDGVRRGMEEIAEEYTLRLLEQNKEALNG